MTLQITVAPIELSSAHTGRATVAARPYVFGRSSDAWTEEQKLVASDGAAGENFGAYVSLAGDRALVGAYGSGAARGAVYVFVRSNGTWIEEHKLVASDGAADDTFGWSVSLAGGSAGERGLVGAPGAGGARGAAYVFARNGGAWTEERMLLLRSTRRNAGNPPA